MEAFKDPALFINRPRDVSRAEGLPGADRRD